MAYNEEKINCALLGTKMVQLMDKKSYRSVPQKPHKANRKPKGKRDSEFRTIFGRVANQRAEKKRVTEVHCQEWLPVNLE